MSDTNPLPPDPTPSLPPPTPVLPAATPPPGPVTAPSSRSWEVACHLSALAGWLTGGLGWVAGPLVVWLLKKSEMPGVDAHGKEALNFQISILIYGFALGILGILTCGLGWFVAIPVAIAMGLAQIILTVYAAIKASSGELFRYPLTMRLVT